MVSEIYPVRPLAKFVHKIIRPETILMLEDKEPVVKWPFLIGFERFRSAGGRTQRDGDNMWEKNIYRHPYCQGEHPEVDYVMQHDIYSIGIFLLQISMSTPFAIWKAENGSFVAHPYLVVLVAEANSRAK